MSELAVGSLSGLAANSYVIDVASGSSLDLSNGATLPAGSVLQVVRATDATDRTTTSTSFVDAGLSVTITPTSASSVIYVISSSRARTRDASSTGSTINLQITDSSDVALSGAEELQLSPGMGGASSVSLFAQQGLIGFDSPASTSAQTYKLRFKQNSATETTIENASSTGQLIAIEVAA